MAVILILLTFPNVLINEMFTALLGVQVLRLGINFGLVFAIVLTIIYIMVAELDDKAQKKLKGMEK